MATDPSGISLVSPKIRDQSLVRKFVSQYGRGYIAIDIRKGQDSIDPDPGTLHLKMWFLDPLLDIPATDDSRGVLVLDTFDDIHREDTGKYDYQIGPGNTANRGVLTAVWSYAVDGTNFTFTDHLQVLEQMPMFELLQPEQKLIVEQVSWMFGDLYDSTEGGPHLIDEMQTHFDYERITLLMANAVTKMNTTGFPVMEWGFPGITPTAQSMPSSFQGLLVIGTYLEVIRHLRDSYVEIPNRPNMNVTYVDRTQYSQRWQQILAQEWPEYMRMIKMAKRKLLHLGRGSLLVAGGIYGGNATGVFQYGQYVSQVRAFRFYPAAPALAWNASGH